ncbi:Hypothetical protein CINCED_3A022836 [Cinara cedri]|uniref:Uncharacterized protein n=1 Tax=Cinara cedri TaxID=506608 RepID=A0A5E4N050_9HEMI|nr:Hypothetical protein CINCED_3A022836 [Cinara cedri]
MEEVKQKIGGTPEWSYESRLPALPRAMEETNETVCEEVRLGEVIEGEHLVVE